MQGWIRTIAYILSHSLLLCIDSHCILITWLHEMRFIYFYCILKYHDLSTKRWPITNAKSNHESFLLTDGTVLVSPCKMWRYIGWYIGGLFRFNLVRNVIYLNIFNKHGLIVHHNWIPVISDSRDSRQVRFFSGWGVGILLAL